MRQREHGLDLLRAAAILGTLAFHFKDLRGVPRPVFAVASYGWLGVDLFFVLSGFLIGRQVFARQAGLNLADELRLFWTRRWFRTLPLYFFVLFCYATKPYTLHIPFKPNLAPFLVFAQNYTMRHGPIDFEQSWSLCVEEHFYLIFPIVAYTIGRRGRVSAWFWLTAATVSMVLRLGSAISVDEARQVALATSLRWPTHFHLDGLSVGVALAAAAHERIRSLPKRVRQLAGFGGVALLLTACLAFGATPGSLAAAVLYFPLASIAFGLFIVATSRLTIPAWAYAAVSRAALWSYGAYLWFGFVLRAIDRSIGPSAPWWLDWIVGLVGTFGLAYVTYRTIELPFLRLRDRVIHATQTRRAVPIAIAIGEAGSGFALTDPVDGATETHRQGGRDL